MERRLRAAPACRLRWRMIKDNFRFGDWQVSPAANSLSKEELKHQIEPRLMEVLTALCQRANRVISTEELLLQCWGTAVSGDNPVHKTIAQLRRVLGDSAAQPRYIETIRKRGYRAIAEVVLSNGVSAAAVGGSWSGGSPFRGLESFDERYAGVFFGRSRATRALLQGIQARVQAQCALVLVLGSSGSGKTSLIRAGVLPALMQDGGFDGISVAAAAVLDPGQAGEGKLLIGLADALLTWRVDQRPVFPHESHTSLGARLEGALDDVLTELSRALEQRRHAAASPRSVALFVDRLETIFSMPQLSETARLTFLKVLDGLARSGQVIVIAACRNDFYPRLAEYPQLMEGKTSGAHFDLPSPTPAEIAQMIRLPAAAANLSFGVDASSHTRLDDILGAGIAGSPDALPLLQYTLQALYEARTAHGEMSFEAFHRLGGIEGAIGIRAETLIQSMDQQIQASLPHVLSLVVTLSLDEKVATSRRAPWSALPNEAERLLVSALVESRLFVSELVADQAVFGVAHEALLRHWTRVSNWIDEHRALLRVRSRISVLASRWAADNRRADLLLPGGKQLDEALTLLDANTVTLSPDESELIVASARKIRLRRQFSYGILSAIVILALAAGVLGVIAAKANRAAQLRRAEAEGLMGYMLGDFANKVRPLGRLDLLDDISSKALQYLSVSSDDALSQAALTQRAQALEVIAEVSVSRGNPAAALEALNSARGILLQQLAGNPDNVEVLKSLGTNSYWLGKIYMDKNDWVKTEKFLTEYEVYSDKRSTLQPLEVDGWVEQSYAHNNLGTMQLGRGNIVQAGREFQTSVDLKTRALVQHPGDSSLQAELADSLTWLALTKQESGDLHAASEFYKRALDSMQSLLDATPGDALWIFRLANAIQYYAEMKVALGQDHDAYKEFLRAGNLLDGIISHQPDNRPWVKNRLYVELEQLAIDSSPNSVEMRLSTLTSTNEKINILTARYPTNVIWARLDGIAQMQLAILSFNLGKKNIAAEHINESERNLNILYLSNTANISTKEALANTLLVKAQIEANGALNASRANCQRAADLLQANVSGSLDFRILDPWARANFCLGNNETLADAQSRLTKIGYRDHSYLAYISTHQRNGKQHE